MVEPSREEKDHGFVEGQRENAPRVLAVCPFLLVVDRVPKDELPIHAT